MCLDAVDDPRRAGEVEHRLVDGLAVDGLAVAVCAVLAGAGSFEDIALHGEAKRGWLSRHLVSALAPRSGLVLGQRRVPDEKGRGGEMGALPDLLAGLDLRGALVSLDAGACHPRAAEAVAARGGDHLIALKINCPGLHGAVRDWFAVRAFTPTIAVGCGLRACADAVEERHGRLTRRRAFVAEVEALIGDRGSGIGRRWTRRWPHGPACAAWRRSRPSAWSRTHHRAQSGRSARGSAPS